MTSYCQRREAKCNRAAGTPHKVFKTGVTAVASCGQQLEEWFMCPGLCKSQEESYSRKPSQAISQDQRALCETGKGRLKYDTLRKSHASDYKTKNNKASEM